MRTRSCGLRSTTIWPAVLLPDDPVLRDAVAASDAAGLPAIQVSPLQGQWLAILAAAIRAKSILEIGTLGGYSTIWLARALAPGGRLIRSSWIPHTPLSHAPTSRTLAWLIVPPSASDPRRNRYAPLPPKVSDPSI